MKKYNAQNPKDRFVAEKLLKYLLGVIKGTEDLEEKSKLIDRVSKMNIFPYVGPDGEPYLSNLSESGVHWYYLPDRGNQRSSTSYRILNFRVLPQDVYSDIVSIFGPGAERRGLIQIFSNDVVINDILGKMSELTDYTDDWWQGAIDIYRLWNRNRNGINMRRATSHITNDYFLFQESYCDEKHKKLLLNLKVLRDIESHPGAQKYFLGISEAERDSGINLLIELGVPNRFTRDGIVNPYFTRLFDGIEKNVVFPTDPQSSRDNALCELSYYTVFSSIAQDDPRGYFGLVNNTTYQGGIAIRNVIGTYVSLRYSTFYGNLVDSETQIAEIYRALEVVHLPQEPFNPMASPYRYGMTGGTGRQNLDFALPFESITRPFSEYRLDNIHVDEMTFYLWAWHYTHNNQLIDNIFRRLSNYGTSYIPENYNSFVIALTGIRRYTERQAFQIRMKLTATEALDQSQREALNELFRNENLPGIRAVVLEYLKKLDTSVMKYDIMQVLTADDIIRQRIENAQFWNHIYLAPATEQTGRGYVNVYYIEDGMYEPEPIVLISAVPGEERETLISYISNTYDVKFESIATARRDWGEDYRDLTFGIRNFVATSIEGPDQLDVPEEIIDLDDIHSKEEEQQLWQRLKITRDTILSAGKDNQKQVDVQILGWDSFLREKYRNHCQICGVAIPNTENHSNTRFRIHPDARNSFSDIASNVFCLCPACRGDMQFGGRKRDLREIQRMANKYLVKLIAAEDKRNSQEEASIASEMASEGNYESTFNNPMICQVCVNGKQEQIYFSWEHFLRLAFMFYDDAKDYTYDGEIGNLMQLLRMLSVSE